jgi:fluoride ion exporter CrcB/FEX
VLVRPYWQTETIAAKLIISLGPVALLAASTWWLLRVIRIWGHNLAWGHLLVTIFGALFVSFALPLGLWGLSNLAKTFSRVVVEGVCPRCSTRIAQPLEASEQVSEAIACTNCVLYLRVDRTKLSEEDPAAWDEENLPYKVPSKRWRRSRPFRLPSMCAVCGSCDAPKKSKIREDGGSVSSGPGVIGTVAGMAVDVAIQSGGSPRMKSINYWAGHRTKSVSPPTEPEDKQIERDDRVLARTEVPVCDAHARTSPIAYGGGVLRFASYRYYREFLALSGIDGPASEFGLAAEATTGTR